ncbi:diguanylate cyclase [Alloacidobacterium dinghuense]|uniref:diguanylate cyclase n=1 Tax=Alloacidobacterium dinghuense TaxID=2763107 RepID=A0A7G8BI46_9BACT|nr:diguanylate cyclase [Alloacidobacterium dinghuense]QNI32216.1 diguanylate cyclase [Alloacidobacterium dinghuense]
MDTPVPSTVNTKDHTVPLLLLAATGAIFFICASAFFVYNTTQHLVASRDWRDHSQEVLSTLQLTSQRLDRIDLSSRLYILEKNEEDISVAQANAIALDAGLVHLVELVKDNAAQVARARELDNCVLGLKQQINEALPQGVSPHNKVFECRDDASRMQESERTLLSQRTEESQKSIYRSLLAGAGFLVVSLAVVIALFAFLVRDARRRRRLDQQVINANSQLEVTVLTLQKRASESTLLTAAREELQLCTRPTQAHEAVVRYTKQLLPSVHAALLMINNSRHMVEIVSESQGETKLLDGFPVDACCGLRSGTLRWRKPGQSEVHCAHFVGASPENYLCIPLAAHGDTLGVLYIECPTVLVGIDVRANLDNLEELAEIASMSIAGLNLRARLEHQSIRDGLTNLYNRHFMEISLDREVRRAARNQTDISILMLDVDHFKKFNDTYGHEAGDCILREVAETFRQSVRAEDIICRYGGEEFVIILPETSQESALERAENIRQRVSELRVRFRSEALREITISVGVATYPQSGTTLEEMLRAADRALYLAKHGGRNQVVIADTPLATV